MSSARRRDVTTLVSGLALVAFGVLLVCDATGVLTLDLGWAASASAALAGVVLLVGGMAEGER